MLFTVLLSLFESEFPLSEIEFPTRATELTPNEIEFHLGTTWAQSMNLRIDCTHELTFHNTSDLPYVLELLCMVS